MATKRPYTQHAWKLVLKLVLQVVQASIDGKKEAVFGKRGTRQNFDLDTGGYCNRFIRQLFEVALEFVPFTWSYRGDEAWITLKKLKPFKVSITDRQPGDILGCPGDPGHIALYLGDCYGDGRDLVAENTSSSRRGIPKRAGTKLSSFAQFSKQHSDQVTAYRLFE